MRRSDGFAGLHVVPDHVETTVEVDDQRAKACRESIVTFLRHMADRVEGADETMMWIDRPMTAVLVLLGDDEATVATGGDMTGGVEAIVDASQCVLTFGGPTTDFESRQARVSETRSWRQHERRNREQARREYERERPYLCGCGKRCKSEAGLVSHMRTHLA